MSIVLVTQSNNESENITPSLVFSNISFHQALITVLCETVFKNEMLTQSYLMCFILSWGT